MVRPACRESHTQGVVAMTKKELAAIVDGVVYTVLDRLTAADENGVARPDSYEPTPAEHDEARTLVGMTIKRMRPQILAAVPGLPAAIAASPVAAVADAKVEAEAATVS